jgi:hypothetical protein
LLAEVCDRVLAGDPIASAVEQARTRASRLANVEVRQLTLPEDWPHTTFDLVVLSELAYHFDEAELPPHPTLVENTLPQRHLVHATRQPEPTPSIPCRKTRRPSEAG